MSEASTFMKQNLDEIQRRKELATSLQEDGNDEISSFHGTCSLPYVLPGQEIVLFTTSHKEMPPIAPDPDNPAIRFYGVFGSGDEAIEYARLFENNDINFQIHPLREWALAVSSQSKLTEECYIPSKIDSLVKGYMQMRNDQIKEFRDNIANKKSTEDMQNDKDDMPMFPDSERHAHKKGIRDMKKTSAPLKLPPPQKFVVVTFLRDKSELPEFAFVVHAAFDSLDQADEWVRGTASSEVVEFDMHVVSTGEWLFPQTMDDSLIREEYRNDELDKVIKTHKNQPSLIKNFEDWKSKQ